jgi:hypothetical protein
VPGESGDKKEDDKSVDKDEVDKRERSPRRSKKAKLTDWLVVWNMNFMTFHILGIIISTDFHISQRGRYTTNQQRKRSDSSMQSPKDLR